LNAEKEKADRDAKQKEIELNVQIDKERRLIGILN